MIRPCVLIWNRIMDLEPLQYISSQLLGPKGHTHHHTKILAGSFSTQMIPVHSSLERPE